MKVGDKVNLPFEEEGKILKINNTFLWGHKIVVKVTKPNIFHNMGGRG